MKTKNAHDVQDLLIALAFSVAMLCGAYTWSSMMDAHFAKQYPATHGVMK